MPAPDLDELRDKTVLMLAHVYRSVPWNKMRTRHPPLDIWNHRVRAARGGAMTVGHYISRLCNYLGLQSLPPEAVALALELEPHAYDVLELIFQEHIPISVRARVVAGALKGGKAHDDNVGD